MEAEIVEQCKIQLVFLFVAVVQPASVRCRVCFFFFTQYLFGHVSISGVHPCKGCNLDRLESCWLYSLPSRSFCHRFEQ